MNLIQELQHDIKIFDHFHKPFSFSRVAFLFKFQYRSTCDGQKVKENSGKEQQPCSNGLERPPKEISEQHYQRNIFYTESGQTQVDNFDDG